MAMDESHDDTMRAATDAPLRWTQEEAIAFQAARDCITHLLAIKLARLTELESLAGPVTVEQEVLAAEIHRLSDERRDLRLTDHGDIARIRNDFGAMVRQSGASTA